MTITTILLDLCRVILFPVDISYKSELNFLYKKLVGDYDYSFKNNFRIDTQMINYLQILKNKKDLYMFTSGTIQNSPEIKDMLDSIFIKIFSADEMGYRKNDPKVFLTIAKLINNKPQEILFIDDIESNIEAAKTTGLSTIQFFNLDQLKIDLKKFI